MNMNEVIIPIKPGSNVQVDWGDGSPIETFTGNGSENYYQNFIGLMWFDDVENITLQDFVIGDIPYHQYQTPGFYDVKITGHITGFWAAPSTSWETQFMGALVDVKQWGDVEIDEYTYGEYGDVPPWEPPTEAGGIFTGRSAFSISATDAPTFKPNSSLRGLFDGTIGMNSDISHWDVSNVVDMAAFLRRSGTFSQDLSTWNVENVQNHERFADESPFDEMKSKWPRFTYHPPISVDYDPLTLLVTTELGNGGEGGGEMAMFDLEGGRGGDELPPLDGQLPSVVELNIDMFSGGGGGPMAASFDLEGGWGDGPEGPFNEKIIVVDWGDGVVEDFRSTDDYWGNWGDPAHVHHVYSTPGEYVVKIWGTIPGWTEHRWGDGASGNSRYAVKDFSQFGDTVIENYYQMFSNRSGFQITASDAPDFSNTTDLEGLFSNCRDFNSDISHWDVSGVINFGSMFDYAEEFNQPLDGWNVGQGRYFDYMFYRAIAFNQPLNSWNMANAERLSFMFTNAEAFNQDLSNWNTSNVTAMRSMFDEAYAFNGDVSTWDVSNVVEINRMFQRATSFNQDVSSWDVSNADSLEYMFDGATSFQGDLSSWTPKDGVRYRSFLTDTPIVSDFDKYPWSPLVMTIDMNYAGNGNNMYWETRFGNIAVIDWGDGVVDSSTSHTYDIRKTYTVKVLGDLYFNDPWGMDLSVITDVSDWGTCTIDVSKFLRNRSGFTISATNAPKLPAGSSLAKAFMNCRDFNSDISHWDVSGVVDMSQMFSGCLAFNQPLDSWDVSNVTNMARMFKMCSVFNQDLSSWQTGNVTDMDYMFTMAKEFNGDISTWDVSKVTSATEFLRDARAFNQPMGDWLFATNDVSVNSFYRGAWAFNSEPFNWVDGSVTKLSDVFSGTKAFNQPLSAWSMVGVTHVNSLFYNAEAFNQDLNHWDMSSVTNTVGMFYGATAFNGDVSNWDVSSIYNFDAMFYDASAFNQDLNAWDVSAGTSFRNMFRGASSFNGNVSSWTFPLAWDISYMFYEATSFNQDVTSWTFPALEDRHGWMFKGATSFDQDLSGWDLEPNTYLEQFATESGIEGQPEKWPWRPLILEYDTEAHTAGDLYVRTGIQNKSKIHAVWSDGVVTRPNDWRQVREVSVPGIYTLKIFGLIDWYQYRSTSTVRVLTDVKQWGDGYVNIEYMFKGREGFDISATDTPIFKSGATTEAAFHDATDFNLPIGHWDMSPVFNITDMFRGATVFNQDISGWDTSRVSRAERTFADTDNFNQPIGVWDMGSGYYLRDMFRQAKAFDQDLSGWEPRNSVNNMLGYEFAVGSPIENQPEKWPTLRF